MNSQRDFVASKMWWWRVEKRKYQTSFIVIFKSFRFNDVINMKIWQREWEWTATSQWKRIQTNKQLKKYEANWNNNKSHKHTWKRLHMFAFATHDIKKSPRTTYTNASKCKHNRFIGYLLVIFLFSCFRFRFGFPILVLVSVRERVQFHYRDFCRANKKKKSKKKKKNSRNHSPNSGALRFYFLCLVWITNHHNYVVHI